ncbi:hypothetical protein WJX74_008850 [Apatococcus lobatus]|uniref:Lipoprotein n=1 Tax=Apatococcus lobatus TaxID=904363 RepID=A0AAW1SAX5_9CHLO
MGPSLLRTVLLPVCIVSVLFSAVQAAGCRTLLQPAVEGNAKQAVRVVQEVAAAAPPSQKPSISWMAYYITSAPLSPGATAFAAKLQDAIGRGLPSAIAGPQASEQQQLAALQTFIRAHPYRDTATATTIDAAAQQAAAILVGQIIRRSVILKAEPANEDLQDLEFSIAADLLGVISAKYGAPSVPVSASASAISEALISAKLAQASIASLHLLFS